MRQTQRNVRTKTLVVAAIAELGTALALLIDPVLVVRLVPGMQLNAAGAIVGRWFGLALIGLGLACWPGPGKGTAAFRGMLTYNALMALHIAYVGVVMRPGGVLLWPAVVFHGGVALVLVWTRGREG